MELELFTCEQPFSYEKTISEANILNILLVLGNFQFSNFWLQALTFFDQQFKPTKCTCGMTVAFNVQSALDCVEKTYLSECQWERQ